MAVAESEGLIRCARLSESAFATFPGTHQATAIEGSVAIFHYD